MKEKGLWKVTFTYWGTFSRKLVPETTYVVAEHDSMGHVPKEVHTFGYECQKRLSHMGLGNVSYKPEYVGIVWVV